MISKVQFLNLDKLPKAQNQQKQTITFSFKGIRSLQRNGFFPPIKTPPIPKDAVSRRVVSSPRKPWSLVGLVPAVKS